MSTPLGVFLLQSLHFNAYLLDHFSIVMTPQLAVSQSLALLL